MNIQLHILFIIRDYADENGANEYFFPKYSTSLAKLSQVGNIRVFSSLKWDRIYFAKYEV